MGQSALGHILFLFHELAGQLRPKLHNLSSAHLSQCDCVVRHLPEIPEGRETSKLPNVKLVLVQGRIIEDNILKSKQ